MNFKKLRLPFAIVIVGSGILYLLISSSSYSDSVEQSSSLQENSGSQILLPPENKFFKKTPEREIQSEEEQTLKPRLPSKQIKKLKPMPLLNVGDLKLERHEVLSGTPWQIWQGVRPIHKSEAQDQALAEVSGYAFVPTDEISTLENFDSTRPISVFDARRKKPGVMTGTFIVKLRPEANPNILTDDSAIKVLQAFPDIQTYFVTANQSPFDILKFKQTLLERGAVSEVETEVLSRNYEKF